MSSLSLSLFTLLSLLATASFSDANPYRRLAGDMMEMMEKRGTTTTVGPLLFNQVSQSMGISAQQMFLGTSKKVYVLDKTENNPVNITGKFGTHPAWAVEYDADDNTYRTMDVWSNTFCAGGNVLGNGSWVVFGGNQPVTTNGVTATDAGAYEDADGGTAIRMIDPCDDESCEWAQGDTDYSNTDNTGGYLRMTSRRWYPTVEALEDGSVIVIGGDLWGGYVNDANGGQDNPTYEFFPHKESDEPINLQFLSDTLPVNLFALTWLMPDGRLFMQASLSTILYDWTTRTTTNLPAMPYATRVYPASGATAMLPLTPANNYTATILFCGGSAPPSWGNSGTAGYNVTAVPADNTCVRINPMDENPQYITDDYMLEGRSMGEFVFLPDGTLWMGNGVGMGTAGYGDDHFSIGQSYGQAPVYYPTIYNYTAAAGARWNRTGLTPSSNERMYHSTAILLPDSSILISGSNPNKDYTDQQWRTRTDAEKWYPWYFNETRPVIPEGAPNNLSYGGASFDLALDTLDPEAVSSAQVVIIRGGFHTHAIGFGMKFLQLNSTYTLDLVTNTSTLHVSQMPSYPGPTLFQPGPAMMFLVVQGIPSQGSMIMIGDGQIGNQTQSANADLPANFINTPPIQNTTTNTTNSTNSSSSSTTDTSSFGKGGAGLSTSLSRATIGAGLVSVMLATIGSAMIL